MDIRQFLESGIIEQYVLGIASPDEAAQVARMAAEFPEVKTEVELVEKTLMKLAETQLPGSSNSLKTNLLDRISGLEAAVPVIDLANPPRLEASLNRTAWARAAAHITQPEDLENVHLHPIKDADGVQMFVAFVRSEVEEEVHHDLLESFLILEGSCECLVVDVQGRERTVRLEAGDDISFRIGETHTIFITSARPVKAILQWAAIAA